MEEDIPMKASILFVIVMVLALALPALAVSAAPAVPTWTPGQDTTQNIKAVLKYRHLFNPGKSGFDGALGPCYRGEDGCPNDAGVTFDQNPAQYRQTNHLELVYDGVQTFTATLDPQPVNPGDPDPAPIVMTYVAVTPPGTLNYLELGLRSQTATSGPEIVSFNNGILNGNSLGNAAGTVNPDWAYFSVSGYDLSAGFTLVGDMVLTWPQSLSGCDECNKLQFEVGGPAVVEPTSDNDLFCVGETKDVNIQLNNVANLYGYQLKVNYNSTLVSASGAFVNSFFDVDNDGSVVPGWNGTCAGGVCPFAKTELEPDKAVTGSGTVAKVTLLGLQAGEFDVTITEDILSDRNGMPIGHTVGSLHLKVCGFASASGTVSLQGRATPGGVAPADPPGSVTLTTLTSGFGPYSSPIDSVTGAWSISNIKVMPAGTLYTVDAAHVLYLGNRTTHTFMPVEAWAAPATRLKGGDGDNLGQVGIADLTCIGGAFGGPAAPCNGPAPNSTDINWDGSTNILDLTITGGNFGKATPQGW
jgi:hypothetical protein